VVTVVAVVAVLDWVATVILFVFLIEGMSRFAHWVVLVRKLRRMRASGILYLALVRLELESGKPFIIGGNDR
jgi:hypothetical protein